MSKDQMKTWKKPEIYSLNRSVESGDFCGGTEPGFGIFLPKSYMINTPGGGNMCFKSTSYVKADICMQTVFVTATCS